MIDKLSIKDFVQPFDDVAEVDFDRIDRFVQSDLFLRSLGSRQFESEAPEDIPIVCDIARAEYLMMSQEMWDEDDADEKYFVGVVEDSVRRYSRYSHKEERMRLESYKNGMSEYASCFWKCFPDRLSKLNALECFMSSPDNKADRSVVECFFSRDLLNEVDAYIRRLVMGAMLGGLHSWPVADYLCKCFEWGYMPCGWIGPLPEDGGDPRKCMQVLALSCER
ncbi:MAG: hypothetical protein CSB44_05125 [Gammaproteobacteria bacterium]|nr:MAG: hypothetical protein CSB44_05125 [Gammaproteobacteria bacterium]